MPETIDSYHEMITRLSAAKRVLVTTHIRPDGDALGTTAALVLAMRKRNIDAQVLLLSRLPRKYAFIFQDNAIVYHGMDATWPEELRLESFDALLVADTGTWSQLPGLAERVAHWPGPKLVLDHHLTQEHWADVKLVVTQASAAGEIAAELMDQWGVEIDAPIATALFLAIVSDTGWFQYSNTRPYTLRLAARLVEAGVNTDRMYQLLYQNERAERIALQTRAQQSLELLLDGRLAVMRVHRRDFETCNADVGDTEGLINIPLQIRTVEVSILMVEPKVPGPVRMSIRSKGKLDVARFAEQFGGGGHARAGGLKIDEPLEVAHDRVIAAIMEQMTQPAVAAAR